MTASPNHFYAFETDRLSIVAYANFIQSNPEINLSKVAFDILTPQVTKTLPKSWQHIHSAQDVIDWLTLINNESRFYIVSLKETNKAVGFMFLFEPEDNTPPIHIRLGYLIRESQWGQGFATEIIDGLLKKCKQLNSVGGITAGVENNNIGSIKVLERNNFTLEAGKKGDIAFYHYRF